MHVPINVGIHLPRREAEVVCFGFRYWTCWPVLDLANRLLVQPYTTSVPELPRAMLVLLVWLQAWGGSKHLRRTLRSGFRAAMRHSGAFVPHQLLSLGAALQLGAPGLAGSLSMMSRAQGLATWAMANKGARGSHAACCAGSKLQLVAAHPLCVDCGPLVTG